MPPNPEATRRICRETFSIPSLDRGIDLFVACKRPADRQRFSGSRIVLFVHGSTSPGSAFDVALPYAPWGAGAGSWMDFMARRNFCTYAHDLRGFGRSTRPATMSEPPENNPPYAYTADAVRDVTAVMDWIRQRHGVNKINVVGWSWGGVQAAQYTAAHPGTVSRLALFAPLFLLETPRADSDAHYRTFTREAAAQDRLRGIPTGREEEISPTAWFEKTWETNLAGDPEGAAQTPPVFRAPSGTVKDAYRYWSQGKMSYDPAKVTVPVYIVLGEWDQATPVSTACNLFSKLSNAPYRRLEILPEATHLALHEKNRLLLFRGVHKFFTEKLPDRIKELSPDKC